MSYVIAVTRWGRPVAEEAQFLAPHFGMTAYDLRMKLSGPLPVMVTTTTDIAEASALQAALRDRGHGALAVTLSAVATSETISAPRDFIFEPQRVLFTSPDGSQIELPFDQISALIRAMRSEVQGGEIIAEGKRKFSASRALLTGGMVISKTTKTKKQISSDEREQVLYIFRHSFQDTILLKEQRLRYLGLGDQMRPTRGENFNATIDGLRRLAPGAFYDARLVSQRAKSVITGLDGVAAAVDSNAGATDLSAHILALAHRQGQL